MAFAGEPTAQDFCSVTTVGKGHGPPEKRTITVRSLLMEPNDWPSLAQAVRLHYRHTDLSTGNTNTEVRYRITNQPP